MYTHDTFLEQTLINRLKDKYNILSAVTLHTRHPEENTLFHLSTTENLLISFKHRDTTLYVHTERFTSLAQSLNEIKTILNNTIEEYESHRKNKEIDRSKIFSFTTMQTFCKNMIHINDFNNAIEVKELHSQIFNKLNQMYYTKGLDFKELLKNLTNSFTPEPY